MQINSLVRILKASRMEGNVYLTIFLTDSGVAYELFLPSAGYPEFKGFMSPSLRNQSNGESWVMDWSHAELIAAHLDSVLETSGPDKAITSEIIDALTIGRRYGHEV